MHHHCRSSLTITKILLTGTASPLAASLHPWLSSSHTAAGSLLISGIGDRGIRCRALPLNCFSVLWLILFYASKWQRQLSFIFLLSLSDDNDSCPSPLFLFSPNSHKLFQSIWFLYYRQTPIYLFLYPLLYPLSYIQMIKPAASLLSPLLFQLFHFMNTSHYDFCITDVSTQSLFCIVNSS